MWVSKEELINLRSKINELEHTVAQPPICIPTEIKYCSECGVAYKKRDDVIRRNPLTFEVGTFESSWELAFLPPMLWEEVTNCTWCDEAVKEKKEKEAKVKEAIKVAESCPEAVLGIKDKKACKSEIDN